MSKPIFNYIFIQIDNCRCMGNKSWMEVIVTVKISALNGVMLYSEGLLCNLCIYFSVLHCNILKINLHRTTRCKEEFRGDREAEELSLSVWKWGKDFTAWNMMLMHLQARLLMRVHNIDISMGTSQGTANKPHSCVL